MAEPPDKRREELARLRGELQERVLAGAPKLDDVSADDVWRRIKRELTFAYDDGLLKTPPNEIHEYVPKPVVDGDKVRISGGLVDGKKPFAPRPPELARIVRDDGAWLHFTLTLECAGKGKRARQVKSLWAYDFELVFPDGHSPAFVRFDLNEPEHENEAREIRSHMHPANDDQRLPAPVMRPEELLDVLIRRLRSSRGEAKPRA